MIAAFVVKKEQVFFRRSSILLLITGIYYEVICTATTIETIKQARTVIPINITIHEKIYETGHDLYGFVDIIEYSVFQKILTVQGIGEKSAINILSQIEPEKLLKAINEKDLKTLSSFKGVGPKVTARIIEKLHGK